MPTFIIKTDALKCVGGKKETIVAEGVCLWHKVSIPPGLQQHETPNFQKEIDITLPNKLEMLNRVSQDAML